MSVQLKEHEKWWTVNLDRPNMLNTFSGWLGDVDAPSRKKFRKHIVQKGYLNALDCAAGLCTERDGLLKDNIAGIRYSAIDITPKLVELAKQRGVDIQLASIEKIPHPDSAFDVCYGRHILEHLDDFKRAMDEMIRVSRKETIVVWFMPPRNGHENIECLDVDGKCYINSYDKRKITAHLNDKIKKGEIADYYWDYVFHFKPRAESILHILKKKRTFIQVACNILNRVFIPTTEKLYLQFYYLLQKLVGEKNSQQ